MPGAFVNLPVCLNAIILLVVLNIPFSSSLVCLSAVRNSSRTPFKNVRDKDCIDVPTGISIDHTDTPERDACFSLTTPSCY